MTVLPRLSDSYTKVVNKLIRDFLWNSGVSKIAWNTLVGLKEEGGTGLTNLQTKDQSLKLVWVYKLQGSEKLSSLANELLGNPMGDLLWQANLASADVKCLFPGSCFWRDVLIYWAEWHFDTPAGKAEILEQILWFNSFI